jgi:DNA-binding CsgD family transcriptional regulator
MTIQAEVIDKGPLTDREAEIAKFMAEGYGDKDIAQLLAISIKTVNAHMGSTYLKLQANYGKAEANTSALNMRCWALSTLVARRIIGVSVKSLALVLMFNAAQLDDESLRVRHARARVRVNVAHARRGVDA